jgi:DNA processing protein
VTVMQQQESWITLAEILGPRSPWLRPLVERFGTPEAIFTAGEDMLREAFPDLGQGMLRALCTRRGAEEAKRIYHWCHRNGVRVLCYGEAGYPACLGSLDEPPAVLYCKGTLPDLAHSAAVGVVGSRRVDAYGQGVAYKLSFELSAAGVVIVSGMAEGIDGTATAAALAAGGRAIAVLGCGIDVVYPRHHQKLAREVAESGALVTEYPPGTPPNGYHFPVRNRLISALCDALMVVQAPEPSGALITARYAILQGRVLYTVPGDITSPLCTGSNRLLQLGARPALCAEDVLSVLRPRYADALNEADFREATQYSAISEEGMRAYGVRFVGAKAVAEEEKPARAKRRRAESEKSAPASEAPTGQRPNVDVSALTPRQRQLYAMLPDTPFSVDVLVSGGVPVAEAISTLTVLEIYGLLSSKPGGLYVKNLI